MRTRGRLFFLVRQPLFFDILEREFVSGDLESASLGGEFGFHLGNVAGEFGIAVERVDLIGILFEIEVFPFVKRVDYEYGSGIFRIRHAVDEVEFEP